MLMLRQMRISSITTTGYLVRYFSFCMPCARGDKYKDTNSTILYRIIFHVQSKCNVWNECKDLIHSHYSHEFIVTKVETDAYSKIRSGSGIININQVYTFYFICKL